MLYLDSALTSRRLYCSLFAHPRALLLFLIPRGELTCRLCAGAGHDAASIGSAPGLREYGDLFFCKEAVAPFLGRLRASW